jgi:hypothetical protein
MAGRHTKAEADTPPKRKLKTPDVDEVAGRGPAPKDNAVGVTRSGAEAAGF